MSFRQQLTSFDSAKAFQLAGILRQAASLLTGVILAQSGFSADQIGSYEYVLFFVTSFSFFWINGITQYYLSRYQDIATPNRERKVAQLLILLGMLGFGAVGATHLFSWTNLSGYLTWLVGLLLSLNVPSMFAEQVLFMKKNIRHQLVFSVLVFSLHTGLLLVMYWMKLRFEFIFLILFSLALLKFAFMLVITRAYIIERDTITNLTTILSASLPFIGYYLATGTAGIIDGWIIKWRWNDDGMFAVYKYGARDLPLLGTLAIGLGAALLPMVNEDIKIALKQIKTRSAFLMHFIFPVMIVMVAFSEWIFPYIFNNEFVETALIFSIYSFIVGSRFLYPHTILSGLGYNTFLFYNSLVELGINIVLSLAFSYFFGLAGLALGSVFAYYYEKIAAAVYLYKIKGIRLQEYTPMSLYLFYNFLLAFIFVISHFKIFKEL